MKIPSLSKILFERIDVGEINPIRLRLELMEYLGYYGQFFVASKRSFLNQRQIENFLSKYGDKIKKIFSTFLNTHAPDNEWLDIKIFIDKAIEEITPLIDKFNDELPINDIDYFGNNLVLERTVIPYLLHNFGFKLPKISKDFFISVLEQNNYDQEEIEEYIDKYSHALV
jgi:hypothetical protein